MKDITSLLSEIQRIFPTSRLKPVAKPELDSVQKQYPYVPEHYLAFLRLVGYGKLGNNFMFYSGPCVPDDIFDGATAARLWGIVLIGDNLAGWMLGFDGWNGWRLVGVDSETHELEPLATQTVSEFIAERIAEAECGELDEEG